MELTVDISVVDDRQYKIVASDGKGTFERIIPRELSASIREDMRLLRWKATGLHDPGDALLIDVGRRISSIAFPPENRKDWKEIVHTDTNRLRVRFGADTEDLLHLPWELFHIEGRFVLQKAGSLVVREVPTAETREKEPWNLRVLHVSLGLDSSLRLDEERAVLLNELPDNCEVTFLLNPPTETLEDVLADVRPSVIVISGHGSYDDLADQHTIETIGTPLVTEELIALVARYDCGLLLLWTCESARLGSGIVTTGVGKKLPVDVISFTYPVRSDTAISAARNFISAIVRGQSSAEAVESIRDQDTEDVYSFFNVVHYHAGGVPYFQIDPTKYGRSSHSAPSCPGREEDLAMLDLEAYSVSVTTVLAPRGSDVTSFLSHWRALKSQSALGTAISVSPGQINKYRDRPSADRWLIIDNPDASISGEKITQQLVRSAAPDSFRSQEEEAVVVLRGIDKEAAVGKIEALFGAPIQELVEHPLITIPNFLEDMARGLTPDQATIAFENLNKMAERYAKLGKPGRLFASLLVTVHGEAHLPSGGLDEYAKDLDRLRLDGQTLVAGVDECIAANIVFRIGERLVLSPDFFLLADKWFPDWRTEHIRMFQTFVAAFATLDYEGKKFDLAMGKSLLGWAVAIRAWKEAGLLCIRLCAWYGERGRLPEMEGPIRLVVPNVDGEEKLILEGHLISILVSTGQYEQALALHKEIEQRVRSLPSQDHEYFLNLIASLTQQVDCLVEMDRIQEALVLWSEAAELVDSWPGAEPDTRPRILGQRARICEESGDLDSALATITEAIHLAENVPGTLRAELRATKSEILRRLERFDDAETELRAIAPEASGGALRSRYLHLKGMLMERRRDPQWIEHILESLEYDRLRGDFAGMAISLVTLARIFIDQNEIGRAKERLREAFPYVRDCGLRSVMGTFARLWGEIEAAEGSIESAKSWMKEAVTAFDADGQADKSADVRRMLDRL
jgi:tetratricopeptide (TPR) repeat protein